MIQLPRTIHINRERTIKQFLITLDNLPTPVTDDHHLYPSSSERDRFKQADTGKSVILTLTAPEMSDEEDDGLW